jgi:D-alanyl-D-alanine carboxypeptidase
MFTILKNNKRVCMLQFDGSSILVNVLLAKNNKKMNLLRNILVNTLLIALILTSPVAFAKYASIILDADTGQILHNTNADTRNYPASLTKMMTLYIVFDALDSGEITPKTKFIVSRRATHQPPSRLGLKAKQSISVENAILALVTKSANDVATVIAENISGSERDFALKMTAKARKLGMDRTIFRNASGLPHRGQMSTARDMAKLAQALLTSHSDYYGYFSVKKFTYNGQKYKNHNKLLTSFKGVDGIKTGYIRAAGYNLVASAKRGEQRLIGVVFGGNSSAHRNRHMTNLLNKGFSKLDQAPVVEGKKSPIVNKILQSNKITTLKENKKNSDWAVQVGAFTRYNQAYETALIAVDYASQQLKNGRIKIVPIKNRKGRILHRSRILGVSKSQAYKACKFLKQKRINCMEIKSKKDLKLASNN